MKKPEILAPTGSKESVIAAINGGCDAIYIGGKSFNARKYALNPSDEQLKEIIDLCHLRKIKVFITLNILFKENEIQSVLDFVKTVYDFGADGIIIQDIGIFDLVKKYFPNIIKSASTQMSTHNVEGVELLKEIGFNRIVLARELNIEEVEAINKIKGSVEIEGFAHGALCVCYSGRCLMSSVIGQRSGNRGCCAQPCRMDYTFIKNGKIVKKGCLLSPKDISTLEIIDKVVETDTDSLKIEGRMKSPEYVYEVVSQYRKYIDKVCGGEKLKVEKQDLKDITQIFNRGGQSSSGYYNCHSGQSMISKSPKSSGVEIGYVLDFNNKTKSCKIKLKDSVVAGDGIEIWADRHTGVGINKDAQSGEVIVVNLKDKVKKGDLVFKSFDKKLNDRLKRTYQAINKKINVRINVKIGFECSYIEFLDYGFKVYGEVAQEAQNQPMTKEDIEKRILKTGDTPFDFEILNLEVDENIYMPVSLLNAFRRNACDVLAERIVKSYERKSEKVNYKAEKGEKAEKILVTALVRNLDQLKACIEAGVKEIYFDGLFDAINGYKMCKEKNVKMYIALPVVSKSGYQKYIDKFEDYCDGFLMRSYAKVKSKKEIISDFSLNTMNSQTINVLRNIYGDRICLSTELNTGELSQIADLKSEVVVYGRLTLMTTNQCPVGLYEAEKGKKKYCKNKNEKANYSLIDRTKTEFPVIRDCEECVAFILNSMPMCILKKFDEIKKAGFGYARLEFSVESYKDTLEIAKEHISVIEKGNKVRDIVELENTTGGHFNRGVL